MPIFIFETVKLCILNNNYALCILLKEIPSSDDSANILELLYTFLSILLNKNYYNLGRLVLLLFSLQVFTQSVLPLISLVVFLLYVFGGVVTS